MSVEFDPATGEGVSRSFDRAGSDELIERNRRYIASMRGENDLKCGFGMASFALEVSTDRIVALEAELEAEQAKVERLQRALTRLCDCDWVISLPDRMDAVRDIARAALASMEAGDE